jgi:PD-(D/E)XK nuclease superfamily protein
MKTPSPTRGARIALSGSVVRTKKDKGYLAEMAFATKAMSLGFNVCKPMGETPGFDFILESGRAVYKVQVKSGWMEWHGGYPVKISNAHRNYRADETDFIIIYIVPEDAWYVMPVAAAAPARMASFFPHVTNSRGRLEKFRDAWQLLGRPRRATRKAQLSGNLPIGNLPRSGAKLSKRDRERQREHKRRLEAGLVTALPYRRAQAAWEALGGWLFSP